MGSGVPFRLRNDRLEACPTGQVRGRNDFPISSDCLTAWATPRSLMGQYFQLHRDARGVAHAVKTNFPDREVITALFL